MDSGRSQQLRNRLLGVLRDCKNSFSLSRAYRDGIGSLAAILRGIQSNVFVPEFHAGINATCLPVGTAGAPAVPGENHRDAQNAKGGRYITSSPAAASWYNTRDVYICELFVRVQKHSTEALFEVVHLNRSAGSWLRTLRFQARVVAGSLPELVWHFQVRLPNPTALDLNVISRPRGVRIVTDVL